MAFVTYPLTGAGDATIKIPTDQVVDLHFQYLKLTDGAAGSTLAILAKETTPGSTDAGMVTRNIPSTGLAQLITGAVGLSSGTVLADLTSNGSTKLVGQVTVANPTTGVTVSNPTTAVDAAATLTSAGSTRLVGQVTVANPTTAVEANLSSLGSTRLVGQVTVANPTTGVTVSNPTTSVDSAATLTSAGSTRLVGQVTIANPTTAVEANLSSVGSTKLVGQVTVTNPTTSVTVTSGVILTAGSSANIIGSVTAAAGTTGTLIGAVAVSSGVVLGAGSTANSLGSVALLAGSSATMVGAVTVANPTTAVSLGAGSSANILGQVVQGPGSSANFWFEQSIPFSSANLARSSVATTVDISVVAANANRKALIIQNLSTLEIGLGFSTGAVTTALANVDWSLGARGGVGDKLIMGFGAPLFLGPIRGITLGSTAVAGGVRVLEFT